MLRRKFALQSAFILMSLYFAAYAAAETENYVPVCAAGESDGPGADCVHVLKMGAPGARRVLILIPGYSEGAETFALVGRYISRTLPDVQVWAFDRREQNLIDSSHFGTDSELDYYLKGSYHGATGDTAPETRDWGIAMEIAGLRRVVQAAGAGGRQVLLGGHSGGADTALAYAAWDFDGTPGYQGLAGLVLVDGGTHHAFDGEGYTIHWLTSVQEVEGRLEKLKTGSPFTGDIGYIWQLAGAPESAPIDYQLAADLALRDPHGASPLQDRLPKAMQPPVRVTNAGLLGWLLDSHAPAPDLQVHSGHLDAGPGPLHDWVNDGPAVIADVAAVFAHSKPAAFEWYWPRRLSLDGTAVDPMVDSDITHRLGLRLTHTADIDVPLYVFETGLTHGTVVEAAEWVVANSKIKDPVYVTDASMVHLDPLYDAPGHNMFLSTLVGFLESRHLASGSPASAEQESLR